jgi:hypothetical protein
MVNVKINNNVITDVEKIHWSRQLTFEWPTQRVFNQLAGIYYWKPFTYTPAPLSRNKKDKVYGACRKSKPQLAYITLNRTEVVELGGHTFRLCYYDEQVAFNQLFNELKEIDRLK